MLIGIAIIIIILIITVYVFMQQPQFGRAASGERLETIRKSPHYKDGQFQNLSKTPALTEGASFYGVMKEFFFETITKQLLENIFYFMNIIILML